MPTTSSESLASFLTTVGKERSLRIEEQLGDGYVRLRVGEAERRQAAHDIRCVEDVVIELLRNARDADATRIFVATAREGSQRSIVMLDNGSGIPQGLWERIFEARVTSKLESAHIDHWGVHGRGMALYSIREQTSDARVMDSVVGGGSSLRVEVDTTRLVERADQSTWPKIGHTEEGNTVIERGPHNIIRTCCEFALEERDRCQVFLGSPAEMVATIRRRVRPAKALDAWTSQDLSSLAPLERFRLAADATELCEVARGVGLDISQRTAHRILAGEIGPQVDVLTRIEGRRNRNTSRVDLAADPRGLRLSAEDREEFLQMMERDFDELAQRYYLVLDERPRLRVSGNRLTVSFVYRAED